MSRFTDFKLYWEDWGSYPDRVYPFGNPTLTWIIASKDAAARCVIRPDARGATDLNWNANWESVPYARVGPMPGLLSEVGAFGTPPPLVQDAPDGDHVR